MIQAGVYKCFAHERIVFGKRLEDAVREELAHDGAQRCLVVATRTLSRSTDVVDRLCEALGPRFKGLFDDCESHVPRASVLEATALARQVDPDLIVAIGGGSAIDTAKMVQICLADGIEDTRPFDALYVRVDEDAEVMVPKIADPAMRLVAIPTTLSGAEFSHTAGATDPERGIKDIYIQKYLAPQSIILDPDITVHTPEWVWLSSGIRAVDHAVESICSRFANPFTDSTCLKGLEMLSRALPANKTRPDDIASRLDAQLGVWLSSTGMMRGQYGASHGLSWHLSAVADVPHGHCSCVLLPPVLRWNASVNADAQGRVSAAMGMPTADAADAVQALTAALSLPQRIREVGIRRAHFAKIARDAMHNLLVRNNPRPIERQSDVHEILELGW